MVQLPSRAVPFLSKTWKCFFPSGGRNYSASIRSASTMTSLNLAANPSWSSVSFSKIKKNYGLDFPLDTLFELRTVRKLAARIREGAKKDLSPARTSTPVVAIQPKGTKPPLFVISGLGGNVIKFHSLAFYLGEDQPIYGLLPRGLDGKEPFHTRVEDMASYYVSAIRADAAPGALSTCWILVRRNCRL